MTKKKPTRRATTKTTTKTTKTVKKKKTKKRVPTRGVVAVVESSNAGRERATEVCEDLGYSVITDASVEKVIEKLRSDDRIEALIVGVPGGDAAIRVAKNGANRPTVIAALAPPADTAPERCEEAGADLFALRPLDRDGMAAVLRAAGQLSLARTRAVALEGSENLLRERLLRYGESDSITGFQHFDFFKKYLVTEMKRARRYGYSIAACLVAIDPFDEASSKDVVRKLRTRVASAVSACVRDIDFPVEFSDDRFLMFLPYTDLDGAERVGRRLAKVVASYGSLDDHGRRVQMSVSVGIAALRPGKPVSFAKLMRDANAAVRAAQLKGGGKVVVRR